MSLSTIDFNRLTLTAGMRVLDLGCGEGRHAITACLETDITMVALDPSLPDLATARERFGEFSEASKGSLHCTSGSAYNLPFADDTFDLVICAEVLEHLPNYQTALSEIKRVLKPDAQFAVSVPRFSPEWLCWKLSDAYHEVPGGHIRIFREEQLHSAVSRLDLQRYAKHWAHGLHSPYWWLRCLFWSKGPEFGPVAAYHRFLVWDLMQQPKLTQWLDKMLTPLIGKSVVMYYKNAAQPSSIKASSNQA